MTPEELQAALPPGMHQYAFLFMHPPTDGPGSPVPSLSVKEINSLATHVERQGFRQVEEPLDRYDPPQYGPIHPDNPGQWRSKTSPLPPDYDPHAHIRAQLAALPPEERAKLLEEDGS